MRPTKTSVRTALRAASAATHSYGHHASALRQESIDADGRPIPWYTYPALAWLEQLDLSGADVFEYGSGNSTRWWAGRARSVSSVEDDEAWFARIAPTLRDEVTYRYVADPHEYVAACAGSYDVVVVDGSHRFDCAGRAVESVRPGGVVILDNADWLPNTAARLRAAGLTQVDFIGAGPINDYAWTTSAFLAGPSLLPHRDDVTVRGGIRQQGAGDTPLGVVVR